MISSIAVYPETNPQPFTEDQPIGENRFWGAYGTNKIEAESVDKAKTLTQNLPFIYLTMIESIFYFMLRLF